jgi:hypothetical protein
MISYNEVDKTLILSNSRINVEVLLDKCFCIKSIVSPVSLQTIGAQQQYLLTIDRILYDLSRHESCEVSVGDVSCKNGVECIDVSITLPGQIGLTIEKHIFLYDNVGAVRFYDEFIAADGFAGMLYSDLFNIEFALDNRYKCIDYYSCTDQSNYRLIEKTAKKKNTGSFIIVENDDVNNNFWLFLKTSG